MANQRKQIRQLPWFSGVRPAIRPAALQIDRRQNTRRRPYPPDDPRVFVSDAQSSYCEQNVVHPYQKVILPDEEWD